MNAALEGPRAKAAWANDHIECLDNAIEQFFDGGNYAIGADLKAETQMWDVSLRIRLPAPVERWALMAGDVLHNLRCALDHATYQVAVRVANGQEPPPHATQLYFPFFLMEQGKASFDKDAVKKIPGIWGTPAEVPFRAVQPFGQPNHPLWLLHELSNKDKHRTLSLAAAFLSEATVYDANTVGVASAACRLGYVNPSTGAKVVHDLYDGMPLVGCVFGPPEVNAAADVQSDLAFDAIFDQGTPVAGEEIVTDTLQSIADAVGDVLDALDVIF